MSTRSIKYLRLDELVPAPRNPRTHDIATLTKSVTRFGFVSPAILDGRTGRLVAGHGRAETLADARLANVKRPDGVRVSKDGMWLMPVVVGWSSKDDAEAEAYVIADNQSDGWDEALLAEMLSDLDDLAGTGWGDGEFDRLTKVLDARERALPESEDAGSDRIRPPEHPVTVRGQVWRVGAHRIMCGDCRSARDVKKLVGDASVNLAVTSPPYGDRRKYDQGSGFKPIHPDKYVEWFASVAANVEKALAEDGSWVVNIKPGAEDLDTQLYVFDLVLAHVRQWGWHLATEFCWERSGVPKSPVLRLKNQFEPVYQFTRNRWKFRPANVQIESDNAIISLGPGSGDTSWHDHQGDEGVIPKNRRAKASGTFTRHQGAGGASGGDIFATDRSSGLAYPGNRIPTLSSTHEATGHTAAFPVGLPEFFIRLMTDPGDIVYDPFVGSGSTILAAEITTRRGLGMEISPAYVDVTLARLQLRTGLVPVDEATGDQVSFDGSVSASAGA